jgi:hypothetical protein
VRLADRCPLQRAKSAVRVAECSSNHHEVVRIGLPLGRQLFRRSAIAPQYMNTGRSDVASKGPRGIEAGLQRKQVGQG